MSINYKNLSRAVSQALRHAPSLYNIELDTRGWANLSSLLISLRRRSTEWSALTERDIREMVLTASKHRHEIRNGYIRALYGHSLPTDLDYIPERPPVHLFHGTSQDAITQIQECGIRSMGRQRVHLSVDRDLAEEVARRKSSNTTVLVVRAQEAWETGVLFYVGNENVWLTSGVPAEFIDFATVFEI